MSHLATQLGYSAGGFRLCNWLSLRRLVSWNNHLPPFGNRFLNTIWAVGLTYWIVYLHFFLYFGICNYICFDTSYHFLALSLLLKYSLFFSRTPVLTSSIDVVFVLSIQRCKQRNNKTNKSTNLYECQTRYSVLRLLKCPVLNVINL